MSKIHKNLSELFDEFEVFGNKIAIVAFGTDNKQEINFKELRHFIRKLSAGLIQSGLKHQDPVMLLAGNSPELIIAALSIIQAGGICLPIDPQSDDETLNHIIKDSDAKRIFVDAKGLDRLQRLRSSKGLKIIRLDNEAGNWRKLLADETNKNEALKETDQAVLFYTSGTTGLPKGVPLSHANIMVQLDAVAKMKLLNGSDRVLLPLPLFHVYPFVIGLLIPLSLGLRVVLPKSITGPEIIRATREGKVTVMVAVPRLLRALYTAIETKARSNNISRAAFDTTSRLSDFLCTYMAINIGRLLFKKLHKQFPKLRLLACGGALLEPDLARKLMSLGWSITVGYGLTETSPLLTIRMPGNRDIQSVGKPIPSVELRLQPVEEADEDKKDKQSEIQVKGPSIFAGYHNLPEKTAETFTQDGWFKTGDIGFVSFGNLHVTGRINITIKSEGGKKIQPDEIEKAYEKEPFIREIGVLQSKQKLVALVVPNLKAIGHDDIHNKIAEVIRKKSAGMPSYYRISDFAISRETLPRTNLGKIRRHELIDRYEKAKVSGKNEKSHSGDSKIELSLEDRAILENPLAKGCWEWLTERFPDTKLTLDKSPQVDLNIDSLEWINLTLEIRERLGVELTEEAIARIDTIRDLLKEVVDASQSGTKAISPFDQPERFIDDDQKEWLKPLSPSMLWMSECLYWANWAIMRICFRISSRGLEQISKGQVVFTPNHASYIDAFAIAAVLDIHRLRKTQWAGWAGIALANPFNAFIYRVAQAIPIEARQSLISSLALAGCVLKKKRNLIWFPEGERELTNRLLPFKAGVGMLLEHFPVPVVPVFIRGAREAFPPGSFFPRFHKITVIFGEPVLPKQLAKEGEGNTDAERIANALHDRVSKLRRHA